MISIEDASFEGATLGSGEIRCGLTTQGSKSTSSFPAVLELVLDLAVSLQCA